MTTGKNLTRHMIVNTILFFLVVFGILFFSARRTYTRQLDQIDQYTAELSKRTTEHVGDVLEDRKDSIRSIAYLYGTSLKSPKADQEYLKSLEKKSGFDRIRFVDTAGQSYTSDGKLAMVPDRDYYTKGIQGESGICVVMRSRFSSEKLIGFYSPVYYQGGICGVMVGFLGEKTVSDILKTDPYGYPADTMIYRQDGAVLGRYIHEDTMNLDRIQELDAYIDKKDLAKVQEKTSKEQESFCSFQGDLKGARGYFVPISGTNWMLLQMFPSVATEKILHRNNRDQQIVVALLLLTAFWYVLQFSYSIKRKNEHEIERGKRNKVTALLQNISDDYICLIDVNLNTGQEEQFRIHAGNELNDWAQGDFDYTHCIESYTKNFVVAEDQERLLEATRLETLRHILTDQKDFYIEYEAVIADRIRRLQGKFTINRTNPEEEHMIIGIRDITELEAERVRNQTRMDLIVSAASRVYPFIIEENLTKDKAVTVCNQGIVRGGKMEECSLEKLMAQLQKTIVHEEQYQKLLGLMGREAQLRAYAEGKRNLHMHVQQYGDDGAIHWMEIRDILMENVEGDIVSITMVRCIDEEVQKNLEFQKAKEEAEMANRAKSTFLFNMSHDIRTPINAIMGFSSMAERYKDDPEKVEDCLKKIHYSGEHLLRLINNVLDMARIESGKLEMNIQAHYVPATIRSVEYMFQPDVRRKKLNFQVDYEIEDKIVFFDLLLVNQIEYNLISNAIKYTPEGGTITYQVVQISAEDGYATYECRVKDSGIGMSEEFQSHIFDVFARENNQIVNRIEGAGLGLSITKGLIEQMGGTIACNSVDGEGTEFIYTLRFKIGSAEDLQTENNNGKYSTEVEGQRILLVEDNELNREISCDILQHDGFSVEVAEDGKAAVEKMKEAKDGYYDLILMDIQMPQLNGYEATRQIRQIGREYCRKIPILAVTANAFEEDKQEALRAGMNGHVAKPIRIEELRKEIGKYI